MIKGIKDFGNFTFEKGEGNAFLNGKKAFEEIKNDNFIKNLSSFTDGINEEKDRSSFFKSILSGYESDKPIELSKKLAKFSNRIDSAISKLR